MKIAVWKTGHEIADRVAESLKEGLNGEIRYTSEWRSTYGSEGQINIGYGILRGSDAVFRESKDWFNVDRGYFNPGHYDGYYRISYKGTQAKYDADFPVTPHEWNLEPVRKYDKSKPVLVCPPTAPVAEFYGWGNEWFGNMLHVHNNPNFILRRKGNQSPIPWDDISAVVTFNSSVGWQAIQRGILCLSDTTHSVVGSYYNTKSIDELIEMFNTKPREPLLNFMRAHQFTLAEIEQGKACSLIRHYISSSVGMEGKPSVAMSPPTPSAEGLKARFQ